MSVICQKSHVSTFKVSHFFFLNADDVSTIWVAVKVIMPTCEYIFQLHYSVNQFYFHESMTDITFLVCQ